MKQNKNTYLLFGLLVGSGFLMYRYIHPDITVPPLSDQRASVIESLDEEIFYGENGEEQIYSKTRSFSNAQSNLIASQQQKENETTTTKTSKAVTTLLQKVFKKEVKKETFPSVYAVLYTDTLDMYGTDDCIAELGDTTQKKSEKKITYTKDNFRLEKTLIEGENAYLFVEADTTPKDICGQAVILADSNNQAIKNVYVLVNEK